jgi:hypothetical protein
MPRKFTNLHDAIQLILDGARLKASFVGRIGRCWLVWDGQSFPITVATYHRIRNRNIVVLESRDGSEMTYRYAS